MVVGINICVCRVCACYINKSFPLCFVCLPRFEINCSHIEPWCAEKLRVDCADLEHSHGLCLLLQMWRSVYVCVCVSV
jgi:hypothetical protein